MHTLSLLGTVHPKMEATCNWAAVAAVLGHLEMSAVRILRDCAHSMEGAPDNQPGAPKAPPKEPVGWPCREPRSEPNNNVKCTFYKRFY